jgi:hypothetical protein
MAKDFTEYSHIKLYLSDILAELDSAQEDLTRSLLRVRPEEETDGLKQQIGIIQGFAKSIDKLKSTFGAL